VWWYLREGKGKQRRLRWGNMDGGLHIFTRNRTKKPLAIASSGAGKGLRGRGGRGDPTYVR
jgi:hypothetical protein